MTKSHDKLCSYANKLNRLHLSNITRQKALSKRTSGESDAKNVSEKQASTARMQRPQNTVQ